MVTTSWAGFWREVRISHYGQLQNGTDAFSHRYAYTSPGPPVSKDPMGLLPSIHPCSQSCGNKKHKGFDTPRTHLPLSGRSWNRHLVTLYLSIPPKTAPAAGCSPRTSCRVASRTLGSGPHLPSNLLAGCPGKGQALTFVGMTLYK